MPTTSFCSGLPSGLARLTRFVAEDQPAARGSRRLLAALRAIPGAAGCCGSCGGEVAAAVLLGRWGGAGRRCGRGGSPVAAGATAWRGRERHGGAGAGRGDRPRRGAPARVGRRPDRRRGCRPAAPGVEMSMPPPMAPAATGRAGPEGVGGRRRLDVRRGGGGSDDGRRGGTNRGRSDDRGRS